MSEGPEEELFELLADDYARAILIATSREPMTAKALSESQEMSLPTVYRRVERLQTFDLIEERIQIDPDGHHRSVYHPTLDHIDVDLDGGELDVRVRLREDAADRFTRMWTAMRGGG